MSLPLPLSLEAARQQVLEPTFAHLLPGKYSSAQASVMLLAIALHESGLRTRQQLGGPARSLWQMEQGGGIRGVLQHRATATQARAVCTLRAVAPVESDVYAAFLLDDQLACAFARLLLWSDGAPLPALIDVDAAWECYLRNWCPGAYARGDAAQRAALRARFAAHHADALREVTHAPQVSA